MYVLNKAKVTAEDCEFIVYINLFDKTTITSGKYVNQTTGSLETNASYFASDYISVKENTNYVYSNGSSVAGSRYAVYNSAKAYISGALFTDPSIAIPENGAYIRISDYLTKVDSSQLEEGTTPSSYIPHAPKIDIDLLPETDRKTINNGFIRKTGSLTNGGSLSGVQNNLKKNNIYSFSCKVTALSVLKIGHGTTEYESSYLTITPTNANYTEMTPTAVTTEHQHGLTISDFLNVLIVFGEGTADITINTSSGSYNFESNWNGSAKAYPYVTCVNGNLSDCVFTWCSDDFKKSLWFFGDSYINYRHATRWTYYLKQNEWLKNILLNGFGGEGSADAYTSLRNALNYGIPEFIVWGLGMNDGSDSESSPSSTWKSYVDNFIALCLANRVTPILCTIPTVPNISHEKKNEYIRSLGYRYIDFALAVGAQSNGTWYSGMLSSDNVHPTEKGATALFYRAICDCPELTYSN